MKLPDANIHAGYRTSPRKGRTAIVWVCVKKQHFECLPTCFGELMDIVSMSWGCRLI